MTAFDGDSSKVSVYFDSAGTEINISLSDAPEDQAGEDVIAIQPEDIPQIMQDLLMAYTIRTGRPMSLIPFGVVLG